MEAEPVINILVVDDSRENLTSLRAVLEHPGVNVVTAASGPEALKRTLDEEIAIILLDVQMPGMDGFETATLLQQREKTRGIPLIFMTATDPNQVSVYRGYQVGAVDYLFKPVDPDILMSKIVVFLDLFRKTAALAHANEALHAEVAERKNTEEQVVQLNTDLRARTAQLEEANKELESFSYSVSHDLRAPLRHIHGYVEMLQKAATDGQLSDQAQRYLKTIADASVEMARLIDDLLAFSRTGRAEMRTAHVRLDALVQETIRGLETATDGRHIVWQTAPLPPVVGDPSLLKQVLANLIGNAVKYTSQRDPARIEIGCAGEEDGRAIVFVRDNGAGFDMQYAHKLFGVFQRLHRAEEFEGTGIGLATVRRIVARHGGRVWAEGAVNEGATFYVTLPRSPSA